MIKSKDNRAHQEIRLCRRTELMHSTPNHTQTQPICMRTTKGDQFFFGESMVVLVSHRRVTF